MSYPSQHIQDLQTNYNQKTYPLDTMKTRVQNHLVGDTAKFAEKVAAEGAMTAARSSKWKGIEMMFLRSMVQNTIQMSIFEYTKSVINDLEFEDGSTELESEKEKRKLKQKQKEKKEGPPVV